MVALFSSVAWGNPAVTPAQPGGARLAVGFDEEGELRGALCRAATCSVAGAGTLGLPLELRARRSSARLTLVPLGGKRHAVHVWVPREEPGRAWEALVVASATAPKALFAGETGYLTGPEGERRGPVIQVSSALPDGSRRVVVGEALENMSLCGRPAVLSPTVLSPKELELRPAKVQRLSVEEREAAEATEVTVLAEDAPAGLPLLRATAASSAARAPAALTDGDLETSWAEGRGGEGRGEFVLMLAPPEVPLSAFELTVRPPTQSVPNGAAPRRFWLALQGSLFRVDMPEDAWRFPGRRYRVALPRQVASDCVALVLDDAYTQSPKAEVTLSELRAESDFDLSNLEGLVGALAGGGERAQAASAILRGLGERGEAAVAAGYERLDEQGKRLALDVMDHAPCERSAAVYVKALLSEVEAHRIHAEHRIGRCGVLAAPHLTAALDSSDASLRVAALALASVAPAEAVDVLAARLARAADAAEADAAQAPSAQRPGTQAPSKKSDRLTQHPERQAKPSPKQTLKNAARRRELREALTRAAQAPVAAPRVRAVLGSPELSAAARVELIRAFAGSSSARREVTTQVLALATPEASFRQRYLLVEPLATLQVSSPDAQRVLARLISEDTSHHLRAHAARSVAHPKAFQGVLLTALSDPEVRVREAAAGALGSAEAGFAEAKLIERLQKDRWPLVRTTAAGSLTELPRSPRVDAALAEALKDSSSHVRRKAVLGLGARGAQRYGQLIEARLDDPDERPDVRAASSMALGRMCAAGSADILTRYAVRLANPHADPELRGVASSALLGLARLGPQDLRSRLRPFFDEGVPPPARRAAESALKAPRGCP